MDEVFAYRYWNTVSGGIAAVAVRRGPKPQRYWSAYIGVLKGEHTTEEVVEHVKKWGAKLTPNEATAIFRQDLNGEDWWD